MQRDLGEHRRSVAEKHNEQAAAFYLRHLKMAQRAAVHADLLTGVAEWDRFLTYIQGAIEQTEAQRDTFLATLSDPHLVDDVETRRVRMAVIACNERIGAWKVVIELPKDLLRQGEQAKSLLERTEKVVA